VLCSVMDSEYATLIFDITFYWLSRGKVLMIVFHLRVKLQLFLSETETPLANYFSDVP
jgi:hypothetical protein